MRKKLKNTFIPHEGNGHKPHIFKGKVLGVILVVVLIAQVFVVAGLDLVRKFDDQFALILPSVVTMLTNNARSASNLNELTTNELLTRAAQAKAEDMATKGYFAHQSPDGSEPWHWMERAGYKYQYAGENLAVNFNDSEELVKAWQNSPTHNMNLMGPRYTDIGVGMAEGEYKGQQVVFVVQMFASPKLSPAVPVRTERQVTPQRQNIPVRVVENFPTPEPNPQVAVETPDASVLSAETESRPASPSILTRLLSSPRTYGIYFFSAVALMLLLILLIGFTPLVKGRPHPQAALNGLVAIAVLAGLILVDKEVILNPVDLPQDSENALVFTALE